MRRGALFEAFSEVQLQRQLQLPRRIQQIPRRRQHAKLRTLQAQRARSEAYAIEYVERLGAEIDLHMLADREAFGQRDVLGEIRELPELRVVPGLVAEILRGAGELRANLSREERRRLHERVHRRIETAALGRGAPVVVARNQRPVAGGEQYGRRAHCRRKSQRLAARIERQTAQPPVAQQVRSQTMVQISLALADRRFPDGRQLEVVRQIELADRFLQPPVVVINRLAAAPVRIGIGQQLREYIGTLDR